MISFQNLTGGYREEEFLRISLCSYSASKPIFARAMFIYQSKFYEQFLKRSREEDLCEIISKSDQQF